MQPLPHLESCLRLAFDARDAGHPSGVSLSSWFVRAPTRGRKRTDVDESLLFSPELRHRLGPKANSAIALAMDPSSWRSCPSPRPAVPLANRQWLAEAALALGREEGFDLTWALLRAIAELESTAQQLLGARASRATLRQVLHGVGQRTLRVEPFAAFNLLRFLQRDSCDFFWRNIFLADQSFVEDTDVSAGDGPHGEFGLPGNAQFTHHHHIERRRQRARHFKSDGDAAPRERQHDGILRQRASGEFRAQHPARLGAIMKRKL